MMIWVVMRPYLGIQAGDQAAVAAYTDSGKEFFEGLYAKFYKKVSDKDRNAFLASVFENVAEKRTELESVCEGGNFVAALGPVAKALKATAGLVKTTALTQDHAVLIIGAMLATVFTALKVTENKDSDQQAFSDWFDSLKMYLPDEHASFLKSASWETAFESLDD